jgi:ATP-binding cassette ChvD family protein
MSQQYIFTIEQLTRLYDQKEVLHNIWLAFFPGAKIGVLGNNGSGKSTLLRIMAGEDTDFMGTARPAKGTRIGYFPQEPRLDHWETVDECIQDAVAESQAVLDRFNELSLKLGEDLAPDEMEAVLEEQARVQDRIEAANLWELDRLVELAMDAMRLPPGDARITTLSGGEKRRVALCRLVLANPDLLLLDEPTNHLDADSVAWLERYLHDFPGTVVAVTHDRYFLDNVAGWILELDRGHGFPFEGNYTSWLEQKQARLAVEEKRESKRRKTLERELEWVRMSPKARATKNKARLERYEQLAAQEYDAREDAADIQIPVASPLSDLVVRAEKVSKAYGDNVLFEDLEFDLPRGGIVGVIGPNGAGKTTLFRMIVGEEAPDEGDVSVPKKLTVGYFRQDVEEMSGRSVLDEAIAGSGRLGDLHHELEALQHAMGDPAQAGDMDRILARFGEVQEEYEHQGGYGLEAQAREVLHGLGFEDDQVDGDVGALSGGWKMRVAMARVLLGRPDVLLMDEPTNHLDIESIIWLEAFLKSQPSALLMTSHDREFMNRLVTRIAEIDGGEITAYSGNYDFYERERAIREANREAAYARQQAMLAKEQRFIERFAAHAAKAAQVQSRVKALDKIERIELPRKRRVAEFDFRAPPRSGDKVVTIEHLSKAYGARVIYDDLSLLIQRGERWAVMGRNGAGKTTLLKMVAGTLRPDGGDVRLGASVKMGYFAQQAFDVLNPDLTVFEQLQRDYPLESIGLLRNLLGAFQFSGDDVDKKVRSLSGGEKTRLVIARMLLDPPNLLVLDEPTNHLDLATKEMLVRSLERFEGTLLFVSHDRMFLRGLTNRVLELGGESGRDSHPHVYPGTYAEYVARTGHEAPGVHS